MISLMKRVQMPPRKVLCVEYPECSRVTGCPYASKEVKNWMKQFCLELGSFILESFFRSYREG